MKHCVKTNKAFSVCIFWEMSCDCFWILVISIWLIISDIFMSHIRAVERRVHGLIHLYWTCWKNQTEASLLYTQQVSDQHEWTLICLLLNCQATRTRPSYRRYRWLSGAPTFNHQTTNNWQKNYNLFMLRMAYHI